MNKNSRIKKNKYILDNPFKLQWPIVNNSQEIITKLSQNVIFGLSKVTDYIQTTKSTIGMLFLCKDDLPVSHLYSHLPLILNINHPEAYIVPLPKHSEDQISNALNMKAISCIYILNSHPYFNELNFIVKNNVEKMIIPWLCKPHKYVPALVKTIQESHPIKSKKHQLNSSNKCDDKKTKNQSLDSASTVIMKPRIVSKK